MRSNKVSQISVKEYCFSKANSGGIEASQFKWTFMVLARFVNGKSTFGKALIEDALLRFFIKKDYELEAGNEYKLTILAKF